METEYYEDIRFYEKRVIGQYSVTKEDIIEFAQRWDPQPFHIDEEVAKSYPYGELIASSGYTMSIITLLRAQNENPRPMVLGVLEYEHVKMLDAVRPGDHLTVTSEHIEKRDSQTKPDRGIVRAKVEVINQKNQPVLSYTCVAMIAKRPM